MSEPYEYDETVECIHEETDALKLRGIRTGEEFWVPKSQVHDDSDVSKLGDEGILMVTEWLAIKRGWV